MSKPKVQCEMFRALPESTTYTLQHLDRHFDVSLKEDEGTGPIEVVVSFRSRIGETFRVEGDQFRFKFEFNDWILSRAELLSVQEVDWSHFSQRSLAMAQPEPMIESKAFNQDHQFQISGSYNRNNVLLKTKMPIYKRDFEVEIPRIVIEGKEYPSHVFKYKWKNRWVAFDQSGC